MPITDYGTVDQFQAIPVPVQKPQAPTQDSMGVTNLPGIKSYVTKGIDAAGRTIGIGGPTPGFVGPLPAGTTPTAMTATPLSSIGTAATVGAIGGQQIAKWTGGNEMGGSIGGAIGGAAGSFAAGTAGGLAAGAAVGIGAQALNFVLPGLGIIVGGLAGSVFGPDDPNLTSEFTSEIGKEGSLQGIQVGAKHIGPEAAQYVATNMDSYIQNIQKKTGLDLSGFKIRGGKGGGKEGTGFINVPSVGQRGLDPYRETTNKVKRFEFDINKPQELNKAMHQAILHLATVSGAPDGMIRDINKLTPDKFVSSYSSSGQARSPEGIPLVDPGRVRPKSKFEEFAEEYRRKQNV